VRQRSRQVDPYCGAAVAGQGRHPTLDQQPPSLSRTPQPVVATPPNPHHVTGGPIQEQLKHPPGATTVQRFDLAAACHPQFAEQLKAPVKTSPMDHVLASPVQHLGANPNAIPPGTVAAGRRSFGPDGIPAGPPDILGQSAGAPLAGAIAAHMGAPPPFGISQVDASGTAPGW
jgi:hypothetical protein